MHIIYKDKWLKRKIDNGNEQELNSNMEMTNTSYENETAE